LVKLNKTSKILLHNVRGSFFMPRNELTKEEIKCEVLKLKKKLQHEHYSEGIKFLADKYLNAVLDKIDEYAR